MESNDKRKRESESYREARGMRLNAQEGAQRKCFKNVFVSIASACFGALLGRRQVRIYVSTRPSGHAEPSNFNRIKDLSP